MHNKCLLLLWLISLGMITLSGCAQQIAKSPTTAPSAIGDALSGESAHVAPQLPQAAQPAPLSEPSTTTPTADAAAMKEKVTASTTQADAATQPIPAPVVIDTINKMNHHPRVRYLSGTAQYSYYVGGRLDARYDINTNVLVITNDKTTGDSAVTCRYANNGKMIAEKKATSPKVVGECNTLMEELSNYLSR